MEYAFFSALALNALTLILSQIERKRLLDAVIARNPQEFRKLQMKKEKAKTADEIELAVPTEIEFGY